MFRTTRKYKKALPPESGQIAGAVRDIILANDNSAAVYIFGSRARGDASEESDWDFLVLTERRDAEELAAVLRTKIRTGVESRWHIAVSLLVKNRQVWEDDYAVTNIYESIEEEGVAL